MSKIQQVEGHGFRGLDGIVPLDAKTILRGPVGSGKSSVLDAIAWAVLGYVPRMGKTKTAGLFSVDKASVTVTLDDGTWFEREAVTFKGSVSTSVRFSGPETKDTEGALAQATILSLFGGSEEDAAELLDVRALLAAPPAERTRRVEALLAASAPDPVVMVSKAGALAVIRMTGQEKAKLPADVEAIRTLARAAGAALDPEGRKAAGLAWAPFPEILKTKGPVAAFDRAKELKLEHGREAKRLAAFLGEEAPVVDAAKVAALRQKRDDLARKAGAGKGAREAGARAAETANRAKSLRLAASDVALVGAIAEARKLLGAAEQPAAVPVPAIFALPAEVKTIRDQRVAEAKRAKDAAALQRASLDAIEDRSAVDVAVEAAADASDKAERAHADAAGSAWTVLREGPVEALRVSIETLGAAFEAPEIVDVVEKFAPVLEAIDAQRGVSTTALREAADAAAAAYEAALLDRDELYQRNATRAEREAAAKGLEEQAAALTREAESLVETARRSHDAAERGRIEKWQKDAAAATAAVTQRRATLARLESELALRTTAAERAEAEATEAARAAAAAGAPTAAEPDVGAALSKAEADLVAAEAAKAKADGQATARAGHAAEKALEVAFAAIEWACAKVRDDAVADRAAPVTSGMREVLALAGWGSDPYLRAGKGASGPEFGWVDEKGHERAVADLSGGETAVFMAALVVTLARIRKVALPLLLLEAEGVVGDGDVVDALLAGLGVLGDLQVVVAGRIPEAPEPWSVVEFPLAGPEPAAE